MQNHVEFGLNYDFSSFQDCIDLTVEDLESFKHDCAIAFSARSIVDSNEDYSSGATYFVKENQVTRCFLEELALKIFHFHVKDTVYDPTNSGCEWWTQVIDCRDDVGFHWDRDYGLEEDQGIHVYPQLATVTYLTNCGGPTLILDKIGTKNKIDDITGYTDNMVISKPVFGKHIKFDARLLHAAPCDILQEEEEDDEGEDSSEEESQGSGSDSDDNSVGEGEEKGNENDNKKSKDNNKIAGNNENDENDDDNDDNGSEESDTEHPKRITFLVNIWLNHIPIQSIPFPEKKLGGLKLLSNSSLHSHECKSSSCFHINKNEKKFGNKLENKGKICDKTIIPKITYESSIEKQSANKSSDNNINNSNDNQEKNNDNINNNNNKNDNKDRVWKFANGNKKYQVSIPLPPVEQLVAELNKNDAFQLIYNNGNENSDNSSDINGHRNKIKLISITEIIKNKNTKNSNEIGIDYNDSKMVGKDEKIVEKILTRKRLR